MCALTFDGNPSSSPSYWEKVNLRDHVSTLDPQERDANLLLHMSDIARKVCMAAKKDSVSSKNGVRRISKTLRGRLAPDAIDSTYQDVAKFTNFERTDQTMRTCVMEFDMLRE